MRERKPQYQEDFPGGLSVNVTYLGITRGIPSKNRWLYKVYRHGNPTPIADGVYERETSRILDLSNVANQIFSFYTKSAYKEQDGKFIMNMADLDGSKMMDHPDIASGNGFIAHARGLIAGLYYSKPPNWLPDLNDVFVVWFCKTLQHQKALISTNAGDDRYYEVTYNGDTGETYVDAYKKDEHIVIPRKN